MRGDGKGQSHIHPARIIFDRRIDKSFDFREGDNLVKFAVRLSAAHSQDGAVKVDILSSGKFRMKSGADFEQTANPSIEGDAPGGRLSDPRKDFEQRRLTCSIPADNADHFARADLKTEISQGPDGFETRPSQLAKLLQWRLGQPGKYFTEILVGAGRGA